MTTRLCVGLRRALSAAGMSALLAGGAFADEAIRAQIAALDAESFAERQRAAVALMERGEAALPLLREAAESESVEQRARAMQLIERINGRRLEKGFGSLGKLEDAEISVERGMVLVAQILDPEVSEEMVSDQLDAIVEAVRASLPADTDASELEPLAAMQAMVAVLRDRLQLKGDLLNYNHPDNSSIHRVLKQKDGLPILLSEITVAVGRRLEIEVVGLPVPRRYMIEFQGAGGEKGIMLDPFDGWEVRSQEDIAHRLRLGADVVLPATPRETLVRMLSNLESDFLEVGEVRQARATAKYRILMERDE